MFLHLDGRYRKTNECNFLEQVDEELTKFVKNSKHNRVLVFPPLASQYRFLIHQLVGNYPALQTVSIGQGKERRTVVYQGERRYGRFGAETFGPFRPLSTDDRNMCAEQLTGGRTKILYYNTDHRTLVNIIILAKVMLVALRPKS